MTTEIEALKTNEILRRRKLRLQQVREQSKDIAKRIRQRAQAGKLQHITEIDEKKEKDYLQRQEKLIQRLEQLYAKGIQNVGTSHKCAAEVPTQDAPVLKDLSKFRGKEAAAELRRRKQEKLDNQKKLLERKSKAREVANEISREKSGVLNNKLLGKSLITKPEATEKKAVEPAASIQDQATEPRDENTGTITNDMATQWNAESVSEWVPNVPELLLPRDESAVQAREKPLSGQRDFEYKRQNLFALSEEMPSSLRGGLTNIQEEPVPMKPSLTLVSEYLQNRGLRLRESDPITTTKKGEDLNSIKQTIIRTRASKTEGSSKGSNFDKSGSNIPETGSCKRNSVTVYNHSNRDTLNIPCRGDGLVQREEVVEEDAYSLAAKESEAIELNNEQSKKNQDIRNKIAMTKTHVEKEYQDTMAFLNAFPKRNISKVTKTAFMDESRQKEIEEKRQRKMQMEFRKIEKECKKHSCAKAKSKDQSNKQKVRINLNKSQSPSPQKDGDFATKDVEYSWMPVPDRDGNLVVHTIPTSLKEGTSNNVKFNKIDSYHEYRSRHKHTPPTKDDNPLKEKPIRTLVEAVVVQSEDESNESSSTESSSVHELLRTESKRLQESLQDLSDAERIIVYKILDSRREKKAKSRKQAKLIDKIIKALNTDKAKKKQSPSKDSVKKQHVSEADVRQNVNNVIPIDELKEGIYKTVTEKENNLTSMYYSEDQRSIILTEDDIKRNRPCTCGKRISKDAERDKSVGVTSNRVSWDCNNKPSQSRSPGNCDGCKCGCADCPPPSILRSSAPPPTANTSASSFKTAKSDKKIDTDNNTAPDGGYIKVMDEGGKEAGQFYIGASGFLKDNDYEVVIQLKKKDKEDSTSVPTSEEPKITISERTTDNRSISEIIKEPLKIVSEESLTSPHDGYLENDPQNLSLKTVVKSKAINTDINLEQDKQTPEELTKVDQSDKFGRVSVEEKGVGTSFGSPANIEKPYVYTKPTASTCTQTIHSPGQKPVYFHMSSSTSTAYMSPPELVLPNLLKYKCSKGYKSHMNEKQNGKPTCKNHESCSCRRCVRNIIIKSLFQTTSESTEYENSITPPKTGMSYNDNIYGSNKSTKGSIHSSPIPTCRKKKHRRCYRSKSDIQIKMQKEGFDKHSKKTINLKRVDKAKLHPIVKDYVNKLLQLNKEGLKAIEVTNQECSSVSTPGSSIIDITGNISNSKTAVNTKISLEHLKNIIKEQVIKECINNQIVSHTISVKQNKHMASVKHKTSKKHLHRVKSLNVSKQLKKTKKVQTMEKDNADKNISTSSSTGNQNRNNNITNERRTHIKERRSKSIPTPRLSGDNRHNVESKLFPKNVILQRTETTKNVPINLRNNSSHKSQSSSSEKSHTPEKSTNISTQTSHTNNIDTNFVKLAEDKLQNMEKIADLTEKCSQRLSSLAKVLEEVRKNKSIIYSQLSNTDSTASDSDQKSDKRENSPLEAEVNYEDNCDAKKIPECSPLKVPVVPPLSHNFDVSDTSTSSITVNNEHTNKSKGKPPPALSRMHLKHGFDQIIPHELSTVLEVDSPLSVKLKNQPVSDKISPDGGLDPQLHSKTETEEDYKQEDSTTNLKLNEPNDPDILQNNITSKQISKLLSTESSDDSKIQMMDLKQFNDIMLKPFISLQEYAKQNNIGTLDEGSNVENLQRDNINEELSSMHSDSSLPDVIAELLKRNLISEPFKFDTASNLNSNTISSDSTMSVLALSRVNKGKRKSSVLFKNKENISETSDTLSMSSNPDLENAFKKLGMGWASSTLKKTKERLALSSSSNSSNTSISAQVYRTKNLNENNVPDTFPDSIAIQKVSNKQSQRKSSIEISKHAEQQTSFSNSMTVKDFLANELAKKITFSKSRRNDTEEFVSLYETKMPDEIAHSVNNPKQDSNDTLPSGNRARTSTPVQLYKSMTYQSSSSSNISNGLFSNADELSSVKVTSNSLRNHSTSDKDDLTIPNCSLKIKKGSESKSD